MEFVLLVLVFWVAAMGALWVVCDNRGRSKHFIWWGFFLGWLGAIIGIAIMVSGPKGGTQ